MEWQEKPKIANKKQSRRIIPTNHHIGYLSASEYIKKPTNTFEHKKNNKSNNLQQSTHTQTTPNNLDTINTNSRHIINRGIKRHNPLGSPKSNDTRKIGCDLHDNLGIENNSISSRPGLSHFPNTKKETNTIDRDQPFQSLTSQTKIQIIENSELLYNRIASQAIDGNRIEVAWAHYVDNTKLMQHEMHHIIQQRMAKFCHKSYWLQRDQAEQEANTRNTITPCGENRLMQTYHDFSNAEHNKCKSDIFHLTDKQIRNAIKINSKHNVRDLIQMESVLNIKISNNEFTPEIIQSIAQFQNIVHLPITGVYDRRTRNAMYYIHIYNEISKINDYKLDKYFAIAQMAIETGHIVKSNMGGVKIKCKSTFDSEWTDEYYSRHEYEQKVKEIKTRMNYDNVIENHIILKPGEAKNRREHYRVRNCFRRYNSPNEFYESHLRTIESIVRRNSNSNDTDDIDSILANGERLAEVIQKGKHPYATSQDDYHKKIIHKMAHVRSIVDAYRSSHTCTNEF